MIEAIERTVQDQSIDSIFTDGPIKGAIPADRLNSFITCFNRATFDKAISIRQDVGSFDLPISTPIMAKYYDDALPVFKIADKLNGNVIVYLNDMDDPPVMQCWGIRRYDTVALALSMEFSMGGSPQSISIYLKIFDSSPSNKA